MELIWEKSVKTVLSAAAVIVGLALSTSGVQAQSPLVDAHIHYNRLLAIPSIQPLPAPVGTK